MALTDMKVYNEEIYTSTIEMVDQMINQFNAASGNTLVLQSIGNRGDFEKEAFWQNLASARRRVDRYAPNAAATPTALTQEEMVGVKVAGGFGPVLLEPSQITWLQEDPDSAIDAIARYFSESLLQDQLNTAIGAGVAAIENQAQLVNDVSATTGLNQQALNGSHALFGDMSQMLTTDIMSGAAYHTLIDKALVNGAELFSSENVTVVNILGKNIVVTDAPALYEAGTPNKFKVLSLSTGGIIVDSNNDLITNLETNNGNERIETTWQADYTFNIKLKGYAWDTATGGPSPLDAELFTGTNWNKVMLDKFTAGTLAIADADA